MHRSQGLELGGGRRRAVEAPIREPGADPVVPDDAMSLRELLEERAHPAVGPLLLEMCDPTAPEQEQRPFSD